MEDEEDDDPFQSIENVRLPHRRRAKKTKKARRDVRGEMGKAVAKASPSSEGIKRAPAAGQAEMPRARKEEEHAKGGEDCILLDFSPDCESPCPICGRSRRSIADTHDAFLVHVNKCMDERMEADKRREVLENEYSGKEVVQFLDKLNLADKYGSMFEREEVDLETLPLLREEDLVEIGVALIGHRKIILHAAKSIHLNGGTASSTDAPNTNLLRAKAAASPNPPSLPVRTSSHGGGEGGKRGRGEIAEKNGLTAWESISGSDGLIVDSFGKQAKSIGKAFILTHFNKSKGLSKAFKAGPIYCSLITARLCAWKLEIPWSVLRVLPHGERHFLAECDVETFITFFDANHICGSAIIILIEIAGRAPVLHTGDFRFEQSMKKDTVLQNALQMARDKGDITLILDTTYCSPQYNFPKQEDVISYVAHAIKAESFNPKTLFLIGTCNVGFEKLYLEVARILRKKAYCGKIKRDFIQCLNLSSGYLDLLTSDDEATDLHIVSMGQLGWKRMKSIKKHYKGRFTTIVGFKPTGWSLGKTTKSCKGARLTQNKGSLVLYEVPFTLHSNIEELKAFVDWMKPGNIIPSVGGGTPESDKSMIQLLR